MNKSGAVAKYRFTHLEVYKSLQSVFLGGVQQNIEKTCFLNIMHVFVQFADIYILLNKKCTCYYLFEVKYDLRQERCSYCNSQHQQFWVEVQSFTRKMLFA